MAIDICSCQNRTGLLGWLLLVILLSGFPTIVCGQLPVKNLAAPTAKSGQETAENPDQRLERLQQLQAKARQSLSNAQPVLETTPPEQLGATSEEVKEKLYLLNARTFFYGKHIENLRSLNETHLTLEDLAAKSEAWQGFDQAPPYPISLVDELRDGIHAQALAIAKEKIRKTLTEEEKSEARQVLIASEKSLRQVNESLEKPSAGEGQIRAHWLHELAELKNEVAEARVLASKAQLRAIEESLSLYNKQKAFLERQLQVAVTNASFSKEEFDKKLAALTEQVKSLEKDRKIATRSNSRNQEQLHQARLALQQAREATVQQKDQEQHTKEIAYLQQVVETRKVQADSSAEMVELLKLSEMAINGEIFHWQERYRLANNRDETELEQAAVLLSKRLDKIHEHQVYIESNLKLAQNLISNEEQKLAAGTLTERERNLVQQRITAYKNQSEFRNQLLAESDVLVRNAQRFQEEISSSIQHLSTGARVQGFFKQGLEFVDTIWTFELFVVEDTISVDGQLVTAERPVTISKVVRALIILVLGLWLTTLLKHRLSGLVAKLLKLEAGAALLVEKFLQSIAIFILLIVTLITVKIPLTAFAFMGGALAIGIGFGAQALINNFISGIILLFERSIKAGDRVEIEGTKGRVVNIGLRCSQVRRYDGVDILVPNSDFLQKSVVNWTLTDQLIRLEVRLGVAYGSPTREVAKIVAKALDEHGQILENPEPIILFEDFGDSALIFCVYFWVEVQESFDYRIIASDLRHMLVKRFDEANITIAFPQLDVHIKNSNPLQFQQLEVPVASSKGAAKNGAPVEEKG